MSSDFQQRNFGEKLESFEAFNSVTEALEHIDSYNPAQKNTHVLLEAEKSLRSALADEGDPSYRKAEYFQAIVSYLKGDSADAINRFESMSESGAQGESGANSIFKDEVAYNLAAAYTHADRWEDAIKKFEEVLANTKETENGSQDKYELRLFAQIGLAHCYAQQIDVARIRLQGLEGMEGEGAAAVRTETTNLINKNSEQIQKQFTSALFDAREVLDRDVVKEAQEVIREAYKSAGWSDVETIELLPADAPKKGWEVFGERRLFIVLALVVVLGLLILTFPWLWNGLFAWFASELDKWF